MLFFRGVPRFRIASPFFAKGGEIQSSSRRSLVDCSPPRLERTATMTLTYANHRGMALWRITAREGSRDRGAESKGEISLKATPLPVYRYANISLDWHQLFPLR